MWWVIYKCCEGFINVVGDLCTNNCGYLQMHWVIYKCMWRFINEPGRLQM